jgi:hypothetical protein
MREIVEGAARQFEASEDARLLDDNFHAAYRLMTSPEARSAFDLAQEPAAVRERYGLNRFGQCCLLARRLVESGVRFVTINTFLTVFDEITWDIHGSKPFTSIEGMKTIVCPMYDQAYSALIEDLDQRGLLEDTLVLWTTEFGRMPSSQGGKGRDHNPFVFTNWLCGGGIKGGMVHGESDQWGYKPLDRDHPTTVHDVHATVMRLLGVEHTKLTWLHNGIDRRLTDVHGHVISGILS